MKTTLFSLVVASVAFAQPVPWLTQTTPIPSMGAGDPAFVATPDTRLIVGTDTRQVGVFAYASDGGLAQIVALGLVNSADARGSFVVVSAANDSLSFFQASDAGLTLLEPNPLAVSSPGHVALARLPNGTYELWVDTRNLSLQHYSVSRVVDGGVTATLLGSLDVPEIPSGLAIDDRSGRLFIGQPQLGVIAVDRAGTSTFVISIDAGQLGNSVGGLDLYLTADGGTYLFTAAEQEGEIKVHSIAGSVGTFKAALQIGTGGANAQVLAPLYVAVFDQPLLPEFPKGVLVVQDGLVGNYKLVSLAAVDAVVPLPPAFIRGTSVSSDGGAAGDGGAPGDGGVVDGGVSDAGVSDGGLGDGGFTDGGGGAGGGSGRGGPGGSAEPVPMTCGCTGGPFTLLPALLLLWWIRRLRS